MVESIIGFSKKGLKSLKKQTKNKYLSMPGVVESYLDDCTRSKSNKLLSSEKIKKDGLDVEIGFNVTNDLKILRFDYDDFEWKEDEVNEE